MKIDVLRTAYTIKVDKEDNFFTGRDYDIRAFYHPGIQATMVRIHSERKHKTAYTTFANIAYCEVAEENFASEPKPKKPAPKNAAN